MFNIEKSLICFDQCHIVLLGVFEMKSADAARIYIPVDVIDTEVVCAVKVTEV
jgi:hypothetical protein